MVTLNITNEIDQLEAVILGIGNSFGGVPLLSECYDPKSREHVRAGTFPSEIMVVSQMEALCAVLVKHGVQVYRPLEIEGLNQIFTRDIACVIDDRMVLLNIIEDRADEIRGLEHILDEVAPSKLLKMQGEARAEGGDIVPWNEYLFVGYSEDADFKKYQVARTNKEGVAFLAQNFPNKIVKAFELCKSDENPRENALHLDCCFQPIGKNQAILYKGGFKNVKDVEFLVNYFGEENIINITQKEMYDMNANVFSISPDVIISDKRFVRLNTELRERGFQVDEVVYAEIAKMEGLFRCSTMPLRRRFEGQKDLRGLVEDQFPEICA